MLKLYQYRLMTKREVVCHRFQGFSIILNKPVPQPSNHESKDWYHPRTVRARAEELLRWFPKDGAFLVRPSEREQSSFSISFR